METLEVAKVEDKELNHWLQRLREDGSEAFHEVYIRINPHIYRTVYFLTRNKNEVDDIVSEVYMALFQALPGYDGGKPFRAWLNGLIVRQTSNWKRRMWRKMRLRLRLASRWTMETPDGEQPDERAFRAEDRDEMLAMVDKLSMKLKEVVVLRYYQECSFEEIASILDIPVGTVKSRHHAAIRRLRGMTGDGSRDKEASVHVR